MAAFTGTPTKSTEYTAQTVGRGGPVQPGPLRKWIFKYTHAAGAGTGEVNLLMLPPGRLWTYSADSWIEATQMAASADLHLGFRAYVEPDGDAVAEDDNFFLDNADTGGGAVSSAFVLPAVTAAAGPKIGEFNVNRSTAATYVGMGLVLYAMVDTGNIEDADVVNGYLAWAQVS